MPIMREPWEFKRWDYGKKKKKRNAKIISGPVSLPARCNGRYYPWWELKALLYIRIFEKRRKKEEEDAYITTNPLNPYNTSTAVTLISQFIHFTNSLSINLRYSQLHFTAAVQNPNY
ncbi:hypothetical protein QVD17_32884 [Tagetes erecta]|uniref:Uncharacterized protein n=1 Tax=Tagetes erecta TaxID=13708 RepID=A0AAD8JY60_TARER|nr:hypothetical protein QVD17_32884 [Tagetes erecta]